MFKNLLIKCCSTMSREDILTQIKAANSVEEIEVEDVRNDCFRLISYVNYTLENIFEHYLEYLKEECLSSDAESLIEFSCFSKRVVSIKSVTDFQGNPIRYTVHTGYIKLPNPSESYYITYRCLPDAPKDFSDELDLPKNINEKILCYGTVSEFLACKGKFEESEFFNDKFLYEIFKIKSHKERRLRSTFCL